MSSYSSALLGDADEVDEFLTKHDVEFQVARGATGDWAVRVRGHDPTGAYHEVAHAHTSAEPFVAAMLGGAKLFKYTWGLA